MEDRIRVGVSACLLGERVRFDGGHKRDRFLTDTLGRYLDYVPVCPEVECGFPVPREPFRLVGGPERPRLTTVNTRIDHTDVMAGWARRRVEELAAENLAGFIFKSGSPSSGMRGVKVYGDGGAVRHNGVGIFARAFMERFPLIPVEDDARLHDPRLRENFFQRIFTLMRWRETLSQTMSRGNLARFHTGHELLILSHSPDRFRSMGELVAQVEGLPPKALYARYQLLLVEALKLCTTLSKNVKVLRRIMGYLRNVLSRDEIGELTESMEDYGAERVPLIVPVTLVNHYAGVYDLPHLRRQYYLNPHPLELMLRYHV